MQRLTDDPAADRFPAISPDGRTIVFTSDRTGDDELYAIDIDGADPRQLTDSPGTDWLPEYSHDGTTIAFETEHSIDLIDSDATTVEHSPRTSATTPALTGGLSRRAPLISRSPQPFQPGKSPGSSQLDDSNRSSR